MGQDGLGAPRRPGELTSALAPLPGSVTVPHRGRLEGIDVARALALAGMFLAHFAWSRPGIDPAVLVHLDALADGRAAPLFAVLLGLGAGLLSGARRPDAVLLRRGAALLALGLALWPYTDRVYLILPHYGLALTAVPLLRRVPTLALLSCAAAAFAAPGVGVALVDDHGLRGGLQPQTYGDLADVSGVAAHLLWTGGYPLVGWVGFVLVGLWLSRQRLAARAVQAQLVLAGVAVAATQPLWAWAHSAASGNGGAPARLADAFLDGGAHSNRTAWYLLAAGSAVAVTGLCLAATGGRRPALSRPAANLGQLALSAYVAHLVVGEEWLWDRLEADPPPLGQQMLTVAALVAVMAFAAWVWRRRFRRGPLEAALRLLGG